MEHQLLSSRLPALASAETRTVRVAQGDGAAVPAGDYDVLESYCALPNCDCHRVTLSVVSAHDRQPQATVSFGWETLMFYAEWLRSTNPDTLRLIKGPTLTTDGPQSPQAAGYLQLVSETVLSDPAYVAQLERHYRAFKADVRKSAASGKKAAKKRK